MTLTNVVFHNDRKGQTIRFSVSGAPHPNDVAERNLKIIVCIACSINYDSSCCVILAWRYGSILATEPCCLNLKLSTSDEDGLIVSYPLKLVCRHTLRHGIVSVKTLMILFA